MKLKQLRNMFHVVVNANSIVQHVIHIKNGVTIHLKVNVKIIVSAKKIAVRILEYKFIRIASICYLIIILQPACLTIDLL